MDDGRIRHRARGALSEQRLAQLVAEDLTVREIAARVDRSPTTVRYWLGRYGLATTVRARAGRPSRSGVTRVCPVHGETRFVRTGEGHACGRCRAEAVTAWRRRAKALLVDEAGGRCVLCGYARCTAALQFHHVDPSQKRFAIGGRGLARSIATLREEAAKCVLLCANCHVEVESGHATLTPSRPDRG